MSCSTSFELAEAHMALAPEEEATALSAWEISCICGSMRLEHVIVLLDKNKRILTESEMGESGGTSMTGDVKPGKMVFEPILEEVFWFDCSADARIAAFPSLSFIYPKGRDTPIMSNHKLPSYIPTSQYVAQQQIVHFELPAGTSFYGTGEVSGQLERTGKRVFTWNTDAWGYGTGTTTLYQSHPWVLAVIPNGEALGILANTTKRCEIDLRKELTAKLIAPLPLPVVTFGLFASATDVLTSLSHAIGTVFMPPKWSLGYQQCRWFEIHLFGLTILFNSLTIQGLSGQPLSGPDIGGFAGNATPKLFARWLGVGAMFPFCRGHSEKGTIDHEPWSFEEEILRIAV